LSIPGIIKLCDLPFSFLSFYFPLLLYLGPRGGIPSDERNVGAGVTALFPCSEQCGVSTKLSLSTKPPPGLGAIEFGALFGP